MSKQQTDLDPPAKDLAKLNAQLRQELEQHKRTAEALKARENHFRTLVDSLEDIVFVLDTDGRHVEIFGRWLTNYGLSAGDFLGKTARELQPPEAAAIHEAANARALNGEYVIYEWSMPAPQGVQHFQTSLSPLRDPSGEIVGIVGVGRDITPQKLTALALQESEEKYRTLVEQGPDIVYQYCLDWGGIYHSPQVETILGYTDAQLRANPYLWQQSIHPNDLPLVLRTIADFKDGKNFEIEYRIKDAYGREHWFLDRSICRYTQENGIVIEGVATDITARKQAEQALRNSENKFRSFIEQTDEGIVLVDPGGRVQIWNSGAEHITGITQEAVLGRFIWDIHYNLLEPADKTETTRENFKELVLQALQSGEGNWLNRLVETQYHHNDGTLRWLQQRIFPVHTSSGIWLGGISRDITDRKQDELQLQATLAEKEVLLREIHHRVKNNLQIISSLLNLQAADSHDQGASAALQESQNRVRAMAMVHEKVYQSGHLGEVDFLDYIQGITHNLFSISHAGKRGIRLRLEGDPIKVEIDTLVPCGLIINELVTNALKYAFPDDTGGQILIQVAAVESGMELVVADTGVGLPVEQSPQAAASLGFQLVTALIQQIDGELSVQRTPGTKYIIKIPL